MTFDVYFVASRSLIVPVRGICKRGRGIVTLYLLAAFRHGITGIPRIGTNYVCSANRARFPTNRFVSGYNQANDLRHRIGEIEWIWSEQRHLRIVNAPADPVVSRAKSGAQEETRHVCKSQYTTSCSHLRLRQQQVYESTQDNPTNIYRVSRFYRNNFQSWILFGQYTSECSFISQMSKQSAILLNIYFQLSVLNVCLFLRDWSHVKKMTSFGAKKSIDKVYNIS